MNQDLDDDRICARLRESDPGLDRLMLGEPRTLHCCPSFPEFLSALRMNRSVRTVRIGELVVQMMNGDQLDQLLRALGHVESLEALEVALPHINDNIRVSGNTLANILLQVRSIHTLVIWPFLMIDDVNTLTEALREHPHLKQMALLNVLMPSPANEGETVSMDPLLDGLATVPNLETLQLAAGIRVRGDSLPIGVEALVHLAHADNLKNLAVRNFGLTDDHCVQLAQSLRQQDVSSLTSMDICSNSIDLRFNSITTTGYQALRSMLEENYSLAWLETDLEDETLLSKINFLLLLNRAGRFTFLKDASSTRSQWVKVLSRTEDDLNAVFYLLRRNPSICDRTD